MPIDATGATTASAGMYTSSTARTPNQTMDSEVFMSLLVTQLQNQDPSSPMDTNEMIGQTTQLQNQDPSSPMDTNEMIGQTTQLAMMEKLTEMAKASEEGFSLQMRTSAAALVGQTVTYTRADGTEVTGVANSVSFAAAVPKVTVNGEAVELDIISGVTTPAA